MLYAAASVEPDRGWSGPLALLAAFVIFRVVVMPLHRWVMGKIENPSPPPALPRGHRKKAQATVGVTDDEPDRVHDWGRVSYERRGPVEPYAEPTERPGWRHRLAQARQVMATGTHVLPEPDLEPEPPEDDIDLALDNDDDEALEAAEEEIGEPAEEYIGRARDMQVPYTQIKRVVIANYDVSESTAKRLIRKVDEARRS